LCFLCIVQNIKENIANKTIIDLSEKVLIKKLAKILADFKIRNNLSHILKNDHKFFIFPCQKIEGIVLDFNLNELKTKH